MLCENCYGINIDQYGNCNDCFQMAENVADVLDGDVYDIEGIEIDIAHNNYSADRLPSYEWKNLVLESLHNGQFKQAKKQAQEAGLDYDMFCLSHGFR